MKSALLLIILNLFSAASFSQSKEIQSIIDITKKAIFSAAAELKKDSNLPKLSKVEITLELALETTAEGGVNFYVVSADASLGKTNTQTITIELEPNWDAPLNISSQLSGKQLKDLIVEASKGIARANAGTVALKAKKVELEIGLTITRTGEIGADFDIGVVKVNAGGAFSKNNTSSVKLIFGS